MRNGTCLDKLMPTYVLKKHSQQKEKLLNKLLGGFKSHNQSNKQLGPQAEKMFRLSKHKTRGLSLQRERPQFENDKYKTSQPSKLEDYSVM